MLTSYEIPSSLNEICFKNFFLPKNISIFLINLSCKTSNLTLRSSMSTERTETPSKVVSQPMKTPQKLEASNLAPRSLPSSARKPPLSNINNFTEEQSTPKSAPSSNPKATSQQPKRPKLGIDTSLQPTVPTAVPQIPSMNTTLTTMKTGSSGHQMMTPTRPAMGANVLTPLAKTPVANNLISPTMAAAMSTPASAQALLSTGSLLSLLGGPNFSQLQQIAALNGCTPLVNTPSFGLGTPTGTPNTPGTSVYGIVNPALLVTQGTNPARATASNAQLNTANLLSLLQLQASQLSVFPRCTFVWVLSSVLRLLLKKRCFSFSVRSSK